MSRCPAVRCRSTDTPASVRPMARGSPSSCGSWPGVDRRRFSRSGRYGTVRRGIASPAAADVAGGLRTDEDEQMQFYLDGYKTGDPLTADPDPAVAARPAPGDLPEQVDVLIIGCGPAGLVLAAQLANFPGIPPWSSIAGTVHSRSARPTGSPAAPWRCSRRSGWPGAGRRGLLGQRDVFWRPDPRTGRGSPGPGGSRTSRTTCRSSRTSSSTRRGCWPICANMERSASRLAPCYGLSHRLSGRHRWLADPVTVTLQHVDGSQPTGETGHRPGEVRGRLRRRPQSPSGPRSAASWPATR